MRNLIAGALLLASVSSVASQECATIAGLALYMEQEAGTAEIIEVVPVKSAAIDYLVIYRAENGNVQMIAERDGCLIGSPMIIDGPREDIGV